VSDVTAGRVRVGALEIAYDLRGAGPPLLLIPGFSQSKLMWSDIFCGQLVDQGLTVVRMDNRDAGESSRAKGRPKNLGASMLRVLLGLHVPAPYTLSDMANDALGLMEQLGLPRFHVAGASMGGMIAQTIAIDHPERLRSLTSVISSPGGRRYSVSDPRALLAILKPAPLEPTALLNRMIEVMKLLNGNELPFEEQIVRDLLLAQAPTRSSPIAALRQFMAILESGDRRQRLRNLHLPTLVIHGTRDPLLPLRGARATTRIIPGARLAIMPGMGHSFHSTMIPKMAREIGELIRSAER
jgi:pimeloyl-ACP methyl ester carboxylesterase